MSWLIEADGTYWAGTHIDARGFRTDPNEAVRFCRYEDADKVKHWLMPQFAFALKTTEHVFVETEAPHGK